MARKAKEKVEPVVVEEVEETKVEDWFSEELPDVDLSDEATAERLEDIQDWITDEYEVIAILDEGMELFEQIRSTTKTRIDAMTALARMVDRLQEAVADEGED